MCITIYALGEGSTHPSQLYTQNPVWFKTCSCLLSAISIVPVNVSDISLTWAPFERFSGVSLLLVSELWITPCKKTWDSGQVCPVSNKLSQSFLKSLNIEQTSKRNYIQGGRQNSERNDQQVLHGQVTSKT